MSITRANNSVSKPLCVVTVTLCLLWLTGLTGCSDPAGSNSSDSKGGGQHDQAYSTGDSIEVELEADQLGVFEGRAILEIAAPRSSDHRWHKRSRWMFLFGRNPDGAEQAPSSIRVEAPAPGSHEELDKRYELVAHPRDGDVRITYLDQQDKDFRLGESHEPGEKVGFLDIDVRGKRVEATLKAELAYEPVENAPERIERLTLEGEFEGIWSVECYRNSPDASIWQFDPEKESEFCQQFTVDPWPHEK